MSADHDRPEELDEEFVPEDDEIIGRALRWSLAAFAVIGLVGVTAWFLLTREGEPGEERVLETRGPEVVREEVDVPTLPFTDVTEAAGIDFVHFNGAYGDRLLPETMGGGLAFVDHDGDGDQDLFLVNGTPWPERAPDDGSTPTSRLYANDGTGHFEDVSSAAGLDLTLYGMGVAVGDYDCDGDPDLYVTAVGPNLLLRNDGGVFAPVDAGVAGAADAWSTCATFLDMDADGDLDLFVGNYVRWSREIDFEVDFQLTGLGRSYGPPTNFGGTFSVLYRNDGDGRFTDVSEAAGMHVVNAATGVPVGKALGVAPVDYDGDGDVDLAVANDTVRNFLFRNDGEGRFDEVGEASFFAYDRNGNSTGAMGIDAAWFRNDDSLGIAIGNFANEMTSLYVSQAVRRDFFQDESIGEGVGAPSRLRLSFGLLFADLDLDGRQDLVQANGHLESEIQQVQASQTYEQPPQLFWNCGPGQRSTFVEVPAEKSGDLARPLVGRGIAAADVDGDGDLDLCLTQTGGPPRLLRNEQATGHHWVRLVLSDPTSCNRAAYGALVELTAGGVTQRRVVTPTRGYLAQSQPDPTFGLGRVDVVERVRILWPDGSEQVHTDLAVDTTHALQRD